MRLSLDAGECFLLVTPLPRTAAGNDRGCALLVLQQPGRPVGHRTLHAIFGLTPRSSSRMACWRVALPRRWRFAGEPGSPRYEASFPPREMRGSPPAGSRENSRRDRGARAATGHVAHEPWPRPPTADAGIHPAWSQKRASSSVWHGNCWPISAISFSSSAISSS